MNDHVYSAFSLQVLEKRVFWYFLIDSEFFIYFGHHIRKIFFPIIIGDELIFISVENITES